MKIMVDFDNDATISTPALDILKVLILQRRNDALEALEFFRKKNLGGIDYPTDIFASRVFSFFIEIEPSLERNFSKEEFAKLEKDCRSQDFDELLAAYRVMNYHLDAIGLTKIDNKKKIDTTDVEAENKEKGL
jgi:hypothetical protein